jgi:CBS domain-containing protein
MKRAREVMIPLERFAYIPYWFTLRQAMAELQREGAERAPGERLPWMILVFSAQNKLLGMVRRREIMRGLMPDIARCQDRSYGAESLRVNMPTDLYKMSFSEEQIIESLRVQIERPISEFMLPIEVTVDYDDYLIHAAYVMIDKDLSFVPVVKEGSVVGIIDAVRVLGEIVKLLL